VVKGLSRRNLRKPADLSLVQCVIFAGGAGSRLGPNAPPKPLLPACGYTLVELQVMYALAAGFREFVVLLGHGAEEVRSHLLASFPALRDRFRFHVHDWDPAERPYGTARALWAALRDGAVDPERAVLTLFADDLYARTRYVHDVVRVYERSLARDKLLAVVLAHPGVQLPYGVVDLRTGSFSEKPELPLHASTGMYLLTPLALRMLRETITEREYYESREELGFESLLLAPFSRSHRVETVVMVRGDWLPVKDWKTASRVCGFLRLCDWLPPKPR
jgi:NDP-sugar pyrophosphorylase family protein